MKKRILFYWCLFITVPHYVWSMSDNSRIILRAFNSFKQWKEVCDQCPPFSYLSADEYVKFEYTTPLTWSLMRLELDDFFKTMHSDKTLESVLPKEDDTTFNAYVQKIVVPQQSIIAFHGDLHGDIHSLNNFLQFLIQKQYMNDQYKIIKDNMYIMFLGDYVDRGWYGSEVIYTILRLKNVNRDHVFMVRGNHEDASLNETYGFQNELEQKFAFTANEMSVKDPIDCGVQERINTLYNYLPIAIYVGSCDEKKVMHYIQCCHGGLEIGYKPKLFLQNDTCVERIGHLARNKFFLSKEIIAFIGCNQRMTELLVPLMKLFPSGEIDQSNGFMWSDFCVNPNVSVAIEENSERVQWGRFITEHICIDNSNKKMRLRAIFRAHQHADPDMKARILNTDNLEMPVNAGAGKLWIESYSPKIRHKNAKSSCNLKGIRVVTFSVAPETPYGYPYHAFGLLSVQGSYDEWKLHMIRLNEDGNNNDNNHCTCAID